MTAIAAANLGRSQMGIVPVLFKSVAVEKFALLLLAGVGMGPRKGWGVRSIKNRNKVSGGG
jgi:hypothetical protein